jgi:hypothetical protein
MNKNVWVSVVGTVAVMGALDYAASAGGAKAAGAAAAKAGGGFGARFGAAALGVWDRAAAFASWDLIGLVIVAALVLVLVSLRRRRPTGHREPWIRVVELGRQGRSAASIAQVTRQPQDAVRILLAPVAVERMPVRGKSFRSNDPGPADPAPEGKSRRLR